MSVAAVLFSTGFEYETFAAPLSSKPTLDVRSQNDQRPSTVFNLNSQLETAAACCYSGVLPPADPCFKRAEQSDEDKDRREQPYLWNETTTGKEENDCQPTAGSSAFAIDVLFHSRKWRRWIARK